MGTCRLLVLACFITAIITPVASYSSVAGSCDENGCLSISKEGDSRLEICDDNTIRGCEPEIELCEASQFALMTASFSTGCDVRCLNVSYITEGVATLENICSPQGTVCAENRECNDAGKCNCAVEMTIGDLVITGDSNTIDPAPTGTVANDVNIDNSNINVWIESSDVTVESALGVDFTAPGAYGPSDSGTYPSGVNDALQNQIIAGDEFPAGTNFAYSVMFFSTEGSANVISVTFPDTLEIVALILSVDTSTTTGIQGQPGRLGDSDPIFAPGSVFPGNNRGIEPQLVSGGDYITWTANPTGDVLEMSMTHPDNLRVLLQCRE
eukprot:TRINITY_DN43_c0_g1_i1.p1 TRINITY_DN43_c0_g1~~TRINITY_DN43_c0_g1_i1.p1  ORF type:complete len:325 (-),score=44.03 TRINITY_DN43_c0_g1_i1:70-1044(-)